MKTSAVAVFVVLTMSSAAAVPVGSSSDEFNDVTDGPWRSHIPPLVTDRTGITPDMPQDKNAEMGYHFMQSVPDTPFAEIFSILRGLLPLWPNADDGNNTEANNGTEYHHSTVKMIKGHKIEINDSVASNDKGIFKYRVVNVGPVNDEDIKQKDDKVIETNTHGVQLPTTTTTQTTTDDTQSQTARTFDASKLIASDDIAIKDFKGAHRPLEPQVAAAAISAATFSANDDDRTDDTDVANLNAAFVADNTIEDGNGTPETNKADDGNARLPLMVATGVVNRRSIVGQTLLANVNDNDDNDNGHVDDVQEVDGNWNETNDAAENFAMDDYYDHGKDIDDVARDSDENDINNNNNNYDDDDDNNKTKTKTTQIDNENLHGLENDTHVNKWAAMHLTTNPYTQIIDMETEDESQLEQQSQQQSQWPERWQR